MDLPKEFFGRISKNDKLIQAVFIIAGITLFGYVLSNITLGDIYSTFRAMGANIMLIVAILVLEVVIGSLRIAALINRKHSVPIRNILRIMFETNLFAVYSPGKVGELMKLDLFKKEGVRRAYSLGAIVVGRAFDLAVVTALSLGVLLSLGVDWIPVVALGIVGLLAIFGIYKLGVFKGFVSNVIESFKTFFDPKTITLVLAMSVALWVVDASMPYIILRVLGYDVDFFQTMSIYFASVIVGLISMIPGGLGSSDFSFSYGAHRFLGVVESDAISAIVMLRIITFVALSVGGLLYFKHIRESNTRRP